MPSVQAATMLLTMCWLGSAGGSTGRVGAAAAPSLLVPPSAFVVSVGVNATADERYAAEMIADELGNRTCGQRLPVVETNATAGRPTIAVGAAALAALALQHFAGLPRQLLPADSAAALGDDGFVLIGGGSHRWLALSGRDGSPRGTSSHGRQSQSMHAPLVPAGCLVRTAENHPALMEYTGAHEDDLTAHGQAPPTPPSSSSRRSACGSLPTTARRTRAAPRPCPPSTAPGGRRSSRTAASLCGRATGNTVRTHAGPPVTPTDSLWPAITLPRRWLAARTLPESRTRSVRRTRNGSGRPPRDQSRRSSGRSAGLTARWWRT